MDTIPSHLTQKIRDIFDSTTERVHITARQVDQLLSIDYRSVRTDAIMRSTIERMSMLLRIIAYLKIYWYSADITTSSSQTQAVIGYLHNPHPHTDGLSPIDALTQSPDIWIPKILARLEIDDPDLQSYFPEIFTHWEKDPVPVR